MKQQEPEIKVGILSHKEITFFLHAGYSCNGKPVEGENKISFSCGRILWNGQLYDELFFCPKTADSSFVLKDVIIGIHFHWERKEDQSFRGGLCFIIETDNVTAINIIGIENYLASVISSEMSPRASMELLKAHAVISRSWVISQIEKNKKIAILDVKYSSWKETEEERIRWYDREDHENYDVCADDHCQRYQGISRISDSFEKVQQALSETRGQILKYNNEICDARFSKCCGGVVEEFQNCWENVRHPYLVKLHDDVVSDHIPDLQYENNAVSWIKNSPSAFCNTKDKKILSQVLNSYDNETTNFFRWTVRYTQQELSQIINERSGIHFGIVEDIIPFERGTSGRIMKIKIVGSEKTMIIGKELEIRRTLSRTHLYSSAFYVEKKSGSFILHGAGWGHGVGLCQIGAAVMGEKGYPYKDIILHYYKGVSIETLY